MQMHDGQNRVVIENITPQVDCGTFPIKRVVGQPVVVEVDAFADGHDVIAVAIRYQEADEDDWHEVPMEPLVNDRWRGRFTVTKVGTACYMVVGWMDHFTSWVRDMAKRVEANSTTPVDVEIGALMIDDAQERARGADAAKLGEFARALRAGAYSMSQEPELAMLMHRHAARHFVTQSHELAITVDRERALYGAWYSIFPRSTSQEPGKHGTFKDVEKMLPYIAGMGFDVLYLTPIHPIGTTFRKGKDNSPTAKPGDPGSPYAIGGEEGGHKAIHPELGTLEDFRHLVAAAGKMGMEIALDNAFNASPEHPWVREHPEWFRIRPDGTIQYAENPPKKYQDIYPLNFESAEWRSMWEELKSYFDFWIEQGVKIFRVDNPHTKAFPFWEWCIGELKREHPDVLFLSEAFTRPKVMYRLAKLGFSQSYTYFAWRTTKWELTEYMTELTKTEVREFFRPNFWPNTHDILTPQFYEGYRSTFIVRLVLAATMTASYGIYGPPYELMLHEPALPREEYRDNEKYEIRTWDLDQPDSLSPLITRLNQARRNNVALQRNESIRFLRVENSYVENEQLIAYTKESPDGSNVVLTIVNLDPVNIQSGWVQLPLTDFGIRATDSYVMHDLLSSARYTWTGEWNYVSLDPTDMPAHVFRIERMPTERNFETYR